MTTSALPLAREASDVFRYSELTTRPFARYSEIPPEHDVRVEILNPPPSANSYHLYFEAGDYLPESQRNKTGQTLYNIHQIAQLTFDDLSHSCRLSSCLSPLWETAKKNFYAQHAQEASHINQNMDQLIGLAGENATSIMRSTAERAKQTLMSQIINTPFPRILRLRQVLVYKDGRTEELSKDMSSCILRTERHLRMSPQAFCLKIKLGPEGITKAFDLGVHSIQLPRYIPPLSTYEIKVAVPEKLSSKNTKFLRLTLGGKPEISLELETPPSGEQEGEHIMCLTDSNYFSLTTSTIERVLHLGITYFEGQSSSREQNTIIHRSALEFDTNNLLKSGFFPQLMLTTKDNGFLRTQLEHISHSKPTSRGQKIEFTKRTGGQDASSACASMHSSIVCSPKRKPPQRKPKGPETSEGLQNQ